MNIDRSFVLCVFIIYLYQIGQIQTILELFTKEKRSLCNLVCRSFSSHFSFTLFSITRSVLFVLYRPFGLNHKICLRCNSSSNVRVRISGSMLPIIVSTLSRQFLKSIELSMALYLNGPFWRRLAESLSPRV